MATNIGPRIRVFENSEAMSLSVAELFKTTSREAIATRGKFRAALSGGSTPLRLYSLLASEPYRSGIEWKRVELFIGDERCVPPRHRDSNFNSINEALLSHIPAKAHRIQGELKPREAALRYEEEILMSFGLEDGVPVFDLVLLGLGADGHTASLFPKTDALLKNEKLAVEVYAEGLEQPRVTLTLPVINAARKVAFLVTGGNKALIVREVIKGQKKYPASLVSPIDGEVLWFLDKGAASLL